MLVLITYDVNTSDAAGRGRLRRIAKQCVNYGQRVQNSVFECLLDTAQYRKLQNELCKIIDPEKDSLRPPIVPHELAEKNSRPVWVTEISDINPLDATINDGLKWANTFHAYLTDANVNTFVWWAGAMPTGNNESLIVLNPDRKGYYLTK